MILPDVNILIYALRDDSANHERYREWLSDVVNGPAVYGMSPQVLSGVVRVCTHSRIYARPTKLKTALAFCAKLMTPAHCELVVPGERHWAIFEDLCQRADARGGLITDAWFAALAIESGCEWITEDRDFARFPGLRWRSPLE